MRILVADDVEVMRISLDHALRSAGHDVSLVGTGNAALALLQESRFDAAVLDLWMPDGDGLSVLRRIRDKQPELRIFVITGGGPRLPIEAAALISEIWGAERVFIKPFDEEELLASLRRPL
ncbi:MAG: response regulator [Rhizobiaceae bacterium]|nr:response regulator [Rhizobiaceae bacterium]